MKWETLKKTKKRDIDEHKTIFSHFHETSKKTLEQRWRGAQRRKEHYADSRSQREAVYSSHHNDDYYQPQEKHWRTWRRVQRRKEHYEDLHSQREGVHSCNHNDDYYQPPIGLETNYISRNLR